LVLESYRGKDSGNVLDLLRITKGTITTVVHPDFLTSEILAKAKKLKLAVTAGIGF